MPPISATITSERSSISSNGPSRRVSTPEIDGLSPVSTSIRSAYSGSSCANAAPTVPCPSRPTRKLPSADVTGAQVLVALTANHQAGIAVAAEDHRGASHAVVVVGQRIAVGTGHGGRQDVARGGIGE